MQREVIVFAGALYDAPLWTNRQHIARHLADRGWRVLYVEPRLLLPRMLLGRFPGSSGRWQWMRRHLIPSWHPSSNSPLGPSGSRGAGLWVVAQSNRIPGSRRWSLVGRFNHALFNAWNIRWQARRLGFKDPILLIYDTEAVEFLDDFPGARVVYDCVDDHRAQAGVDRSAALVAKEETAISARADAVAVTTQPLLDRFRHLNQNVRLVPNAADIRAFLPQKLEKLVSGLISVGKSEKVRSDTNFEPSDIASIPHPRIGTVGALDAYKLDTDLLRAVAAAHPDWHFVLVGPVDVAGRGRAAVEQLRTLPNIRFLGPKPHREVPAYVHGFDVAMIPYRESAYNRASFPLKFWEFMASGKPVVAAGLPSLAPYRHLVSLASSPEEFAAAVATALASGQQGASARVAEARRHSWSARVDTIEQLLCTPDTR